MQRLLPLMALAALLTSLLGCYGGRSISQPMPTAFRNDTLYYNQVPITLTDIIVRLPGVMVNDRAGNAQIRYRGQAPLFVIDGVPVGRNYQEIVNLVNPADVASIELLDAAESVQYGLPGGAGVIVIRTSPQH